MESRHAPGSSDPTRYVSEVGTDTVPVNLVEIAPVRNPKSGRGSVALVALLVGLIGFSLGVAVATPAMPAPTSAPIAQAKPASSHTTIEAPSSAPTGAPTQRPTIEPTSPPSWAWTRSELLPDVPMSISAVWGVGSAVLGLAQLQPVGNDPAWGLVRLEPGSAWALATPPRAVDEFLAGTVVDGRLWFIGGIGGVAPEDRTWALISTTDGESWDSLGAGRGLGELDGVEFLANVGPNWLIRTFSYNGDGGEGAATPRFLWSGDGVRWQEITVPAIEGDIFDLHAATLGDTLVLLALAGNPDQPDKVILTSPDARTWRRGSFPQTLDSPSDLACNGQACVLTGFRYEAPTVPIAWVSNDGIHWSEADTTTADTIDLPITRLVVTEQGFLGVSGSPVLAWTSGPDGRVWQRREVISETDGLQLLGVAAAGDTVIAISEPLADEPYAAWRGSLSLLNRPASPQ